MTDSRGNEIWPGHWLVSTDAPTRRMAQVVQIDGDVALLEGQFSMFKITQQAMNVSRLVREDCAEELLAESGEDQTA